MKNQIWSPEKIRQAGGFQPFSPEQTQLDGFVCQKQTGPSDLHFELLPESVEKLLKEPGVRSRMESVIQSRVNEQINGLLKSFHWIEDRLGSFELKEETYLECSEKIKQIEECLEVEWKKRFQQIEEQRQKLEAVFTHLVNEWKEERDDLLKVHEREWMETLSYLMERFQMNQTGQNIEALREWLEANVKEFSAKAPVTVFLSSGDFGLFDNRSNLDEKNNWSVAEDKSLKTGQIRVETNNAGVVLDKNENLKKLCALLGAS